MPIDFHVLTSWGTHNKRVYAHVVMLSSYFSKFLVQSARVSNLTFPAVLMELAKISFLDMETRLANTPFIIFVVAHGFPML